MGRKLIQLSSFPGNNTVFKKPWEVSEENVWPGCSISSPWWNYCLFNVGTHALSYLSYRHVACIDTIAFMLVWLSVNFASVWQRVACIISLIIWYFITWTQLLVSALYLLFLSFVHISIVEWINMNCCLSNQLLEFMLKLYVYYRSCWNYTRVHLCRGVDAKLIRCIMHLYLWFYNSEFNSIIWKYKT